MTDMFLPLDNWDKMQWWWTFHKQNQQNWQGDFTRYVGIFSLSNIAIEIYCK